MEVLKNSPFEYYIVGGAVRDSFLNLASTDVDYVVEASQEVFEDHFGLTSVGIDFPVYMMEGNEVALTRSEESCGKGYGDFIITDTGVSIEEDLSRRDFSINSMAINGRTGELLDPHNGFKHLTETKELVTIFEKAFEEDPVRILRGLRFAARFNLKFEENTKANMINNIHRLENVTKERVVLEIEKMWKQLKTGDQVVRYFQLMSEIYALEFIFPAIDKLQFVTAGPNQYHGGKTAFEHTMDVVKRCKDNNFEFHVFMGCLFHDSGKGTTNPELLPHHYGHEVRSEKLAQEFLKDHKFSKEVNNFVPSACKQHMRFHLLTKMKSLKLVKLASLRNFKELLKVAECDHPLDEEQKKVVKRLRNAVKMKLDVDKIMKTKDKEQEVLRQRVKFFNNLK